MTTEISPPSPSKNVEKHSVFLKNGQQVQVNGNFFYSFIFVSASSAHILRVRGVLPRPRLLLTNMDCTRLHSLLGRSYNGIFETRRQNWS